MTKMTFKDEDDDGGVSMVLDDVARYNAIFLTINCLQIGRVLAERHAARYSLPPRAIALFHDPEAMTGGAVMWCHSMPGDVVLSEVTASS